jgi:hypothetical protein
MKRMMLALAPALLLMVAVTTVPTRWAFAQDQDIEQMTANAKTAADYEALAAYYQKKGEEAQKQLEWHQKLYKTYSQNPRLSTLRMHCHRLIHIYKDEARENLTMADEYRQLAKKAQ